MVRRFFMLTLLLSCFLTGYAARAQTPNLLLNPQADEGVQQWRVFGDAKVEDVNNERHFVLRNGGYLIQDVSLPEDAVGQYVVLVARASSERPAPDGRPVTGKPYLYGYMMPSGNPDGGRINAYLEGQRMIAVATSDSKWERLWGVFRVPPGTGRLRFFIQQTRVKDMPHDGSAARFDDLGLYLFPTAEAAQAFAHSDAMTPDVSALESVKPAIFHAQCSLNVSQAPEIDGIRLGMSFAEILTLFPRSYDDAAMQRAVEHYESVGKRGATWLIVKPAKFDMGENTPGINLYAFRFFDDRLFSLKVEYDSPLWRKVDDFISQRARAWRLPPANIWEPVNEINSKYIICDGLEIKFFASRDGKSNYILLVDTITEQQALKQQAGVESR